ncbi:CPBP family intramembrane glutamic endopeptidase [Legionella bononiensis]|uniref:CPBP family intramembrane metalloprotease n=1 Tax=Legionella bononiensis TaxID=2793102 RepID=A0ABS1W8V9_9GAMM|nr:CPBP family intramembrane glutamic endopeptidase [Legionella bononiensis]MBL7479695.1 CPBP family intramembrane metalloprotease [Legionella bononiensis]MBL7525793.1 CPBP family intramembrane metalloprotease [Legionella bononiensis]MBL7561975.1 CPBP family intramembrane metalloprotease [Legionella bononiensis]
MEPDIRDIYKPLQFFILVFILTWIFWFSSNYIQAQNGKELFFFLGLLSPCITALLFIFLSQSKALKRQFLNKLLNLRLIKLGTLIYLFMIPPLSLIISILISLLFSYSIDQFNLAQSFSFHMAGTPTLLILFLAACFEELGWRGYGMDSLSAKFNYFNSTAIFSVLWALWHLPLFFINHSYHYNILHLNPLFAINFIIGVIPFAFIINWLWKKNNYSIPVAILFHFIANLSQEALMVEPVTKCIQTLVLIAFASIIIYKDRELFFDIK